MGLPSTLQSYLTIASIFYAEDSKAIAYLNEKIAKAPNGGDQIVDVGEKPMLNFLTKVNNGQIERISTQALKHSSAHLINNKFKETIAKSPHT